MTGLEAGLQNVSHGHGVPIAVAGMSIVFAALFLISAFITVLPRTLAAVARIFPESAPRRSRPPVASDEEELAVIAAIGAALLRHRQGQAPR